MIRPSLQIFIYYKKINVIAWNYVGQKKSMFKTHDYKTVQFLNYMFINTSTNFYSMYIHYFKWMTKQFLHLPQFKFTSILETASLHFGSISVGNLTSSQFIYKVCMCCVCIYPCMHVCMGVCVNTQQAKKCYYLHESRNVKVIRRQIY